MSKNILVPVDGSEVSFKALDYAIDVAKTYGAALVITNVVIPYNFSVVEMKKTGREAHELDYSQFKVTKEDKKGEVTDGADNYILRAAKKRATKHGYDGFTCRQVVDVNPAHAIVEQAKALKSDLIVIGNRGMGELVQIVLGSISTKVVSSAECPVVIIK